MDENVLRLAAALVAALAVAPAASAATAHFDVIYRLTTAAGTVELAASGVADGTARQASADVETTKGPLHLLFDGRSGLAVYASGAAVAGQTKGKPWLLSHNDAALPLGDPSVALGRQAQPGATTLALSAAETARIAPGALHAVTASVQTDATGRVVRFVVHAQAAGGALVDMDEQLSEFGSPLQVALPTARNVFDVSVDAVRRDLIAAGLDAWGYSADHHDRFTGMTRATLKKYDSKPDPRIHLAKVTATTFCLEMRSDGIWVKLFGKASLQYAVAPGRC